jgi:tetratricopeptide (TPR) repeat protein
MPFMGTMANKASSRVKRTAFPALPRRGAIIIKPSKVMLEAVVIPQASQTNHALATDANSQAGLPEVERQVPIHLDAVAALRKATESVYQIILEKQPTEYRAPLNLGYLARERGDAAAALSYFEVARAANPRRTRPKLEMAQELRTLSRLDEAEVLYLSLLREQPKLVRALAGLGHIARTRGEHRLSLNYYQAALETDPTRTDLKLKVAAQLRKLLRFRDAAEIYRSVLAEDPDHAAARERLERLPKPEPSGLPPMERSWLQRETFTRAAEWGRNLEALGGTTFDMSLLLLAEDFAHGAIEEVKQDCILVRVGKRTKILPLVSDWGEYEQVLKREKQTLNPGDLLGPVFTPHERGWRSNVAPAKSYHEFVWKRETVSEMIGSSLQGHRRNIRKLLKAGVHVEPIGPANLDRVLACNDRWFADKKARGETTYYRTRTAWTLENLEALEPLGVRHLAVMLDDDVIGYTVGSHLGVSWATYVYGRGDNQYDVGPLIVHEHAKLYPDREWINSGDVGRSRGLAEFKQKFTLGAEGKQIKLGWIQA